MTIGAVPVAMVFIQHETGNRVSEILLIPTAVTGITMTIQPADLLPRGMARTTFELIVVLVESPARGGVVEGRLALGVMAVTTIVFEMAIGTDFVFLFFSLCQIIRMGEIMTVATVFFGVAINTLEAKEIDMFIMIKGNDWTRLIRRMVDLGGWDYDDRM